MTIQSKCVLGLPAASTPCGLGDLTEDPGDVDRQARVAPSMAAYRKIPRRHRLAVLDRLLTIESERVRHHDRGSQFYPSAVRGPSPKADTQVRANTAATRVKPLQGPKVFDQVAHFVRVETQGLSGVVCVYNVLQCRRAAVMEIRRVMP